MNVLDRLLMASLRTFNRWRFALKLRRYGRLAYLESARQEGATLVLLHGLGASKDQWGPEFCKLAREHHCLLIDLPGHGQSSYFARQGLGPQAILAEVEPLLDRLSTRPIVLIGSSLGGCVAGLYAAKNLNGSGAWYYWRQRDWATQHWGPRFRLAWDLNGTLVLATVRLKRCGASGACCSCSRPRSGADLPVR